MRTRKLSAALVAVVLSLGLGGAACGEADDASDGTTTGEGNLRDAGEQNNPSEGGDTGDATNDDSAPVGGTNSGSEGGSTNSGP